MIITDKEFDTIKVFIKRQEEFNRKHMEALKELSRGLHGEPKNGHVGAVKRIEGLEKTTKKHDKIFQRLLWTGGGVLVALEGIKLLYDHFIKPNV